MSPVGWLLPIFCMLAALGSALLLVKLYGAPALQGRFESIDGLRGYLALAVFVHHIPVWYVYCRTGVWDVPASTFYANLGQVGVAFFFMITGFLFYSKLLDGRRKAIDWERLYISRVLRLWPLYLFAICLVLLMVAYLSGGSLRVPIPALIKSCIRWIAFSIFGQPDVNGVKNTFAIIAGVTWSLSYEWIFYCSLPLLSFTAGVVAPKRYIVMSALALVVAASRHLSAIFIAAFAGGIAASFLVREKRFCELSRRPAAAVTAIICAILSLTQFSTAYAPLPIFLLSVAFAPIACGNTLFGALSSGVSRMLGDMSYSIYLLQGFILFIAFGLGFGLYKPVDLSPTQHCLVGIACVPLLVLISFTTYRLIESPFMGRVQAVTSWTRACVGRFASR